MAETKEPPFKVIQKAEPFEVREYAPMIVAEVTVDGERKDAINNGFRVLADYIFGANIPAEKIAMTAPVTQTPEKGASIAMTAPVTQVAKGTNRWVVQFVMPEEYTMKTLPKPKDDRITITQLPEKRTAVIRFSGWAGSETLSEKTVLLADWMAANKMMPHAAEPTFAFYNPPWTLPFFRRNEVMMDVMP